MPYPTDLTDNQWELLGPLLSPSCKRGSRHGPDLRHVVDAMLYVTHTGCPWRFLPAEFGPWTRVWSQFRRWSRNGTWTRVLAAVLGQARLVEGRVGPKPSMVVFDTHLARGGSLGVTFHDRPGPYGLANGAKRAIAVDWTGLPLVARVVAVSTVEQVAAGQSDRLGLVMAVRGTLVKAARELSAKHRCEVRRVVWDEPQLDGHERKVFRPIAHAWRVKVAHGTLGWSDGLSKSFENTTRTATGGCNSHARSPGATCCADSRASRRLLCHTLREQ